MTPEITQKEITDALHAQGGEVRVIDPATQRVYVLVDDETHRRAMQALRAQEDWQRIQQGIEQADRGETIPLDEADRRIRQEFGFPQRP